MLIIWGSASVKLSNVYLNLNEKLGFLAFGLHWLLQEQERAMIKTYPESNPDYEVEVSSNMFAFVGDS